MHATYTGEDDDVFYEANQSTPSTPSGDDEGDGGKKFSRMSCDGSVGSSSRTSERDGATKKVVAKADQVVIQRVEKKVLDPTQAMIVLLFGIFLGMMINEALSVNPIRVLLG